MLVCDILYLCSLLLEIPQRYVEFELDSSHTHGDDQLHVHVLDHCQQFPAVAPAVDAVASGAGQAASPRGRGRADVCCFARKNRIHLSEPSIFKSVHMTHKMRTPNA